MLTKLFPTRVHQVLGDLEMLPCSPVVLNCREARREPVPVLSCHLAICLLSFRPFSTSMSPTCWPLLNAGAGAGPDLGVWPHSLVLVPPKPASPLITTATDLIMMWISPAAGFSSCLTRYGLWLPHVLTVIMAHSRASCLFRPAHCFLWD